MNTIANSNLCIIPARGGSKRIPRKNVRSFLGKPIIAYSIETALNSGLFEEVMVSTDNEEIAELGIKYGAKIPFLRSEKNAGDNATTLSVIKEVYERYAAENIAFNYLCCIYPTAPFITESLLRESYKALKRNNYDSTLPVMKYSYPIQRSLEFIDDSRVAYRFPDFRSYRSQDLQEIYHDAGQFYWMKKEVISYPSILTENTGGIIISELDGQDIDNEVDWQLAELKYSLRNRLLL